MRIIKGPNKIVLVCVGGSVVGLAWREGGGVPAGGSQGRGASRPKGVKMPSNDPSKARSGGALAPGPASAAAATGRPCHRWDNIQSQAQH